jgi:hypothetical protein
MNPAIETNGPVEPGEVLGWQLAGVTQEEIRAEVNTRRMASRPDESLMEALGWMGGRRGDDQGHSARQRPKAKLGAGLETAATVGCVRGSGKRSASKLHA